MTSAINHLSINENFPVAGQDNDTQVFRDNFDTIKNNFRAAQEEITVLQTFSASVESDNDFNNNRITGAILQRTNDLFLNLGDFNGDAIDWEAGPYQKFDVTDAVNFAFENFYNSDSNATARVGKVILELTVGDGEFSTVTFVSTGGTLINKIGFPAVDTGTYGAGDLVLLSQTNPIFIEIWQHSQTNLYIRFLSEVPPPIPEIAINNITDVTSVSPANNDSLRYETIPDKWVNTNYDQLISFSVKIGNDGSPSQNVFLIDNVAIKTNTGIAQVLNFVEGNKYRFDLSDASNAAGPLRFSTTPDTSVPASITDYVDGVTRVGTAGTAGAFVDILITGATPSTLYLWAEQVVLDTSNVGGGVAIQKAVYQTYTGSEDLNSGAAAELGRTASYFTTAAAETASLAAGVEGQIKVFAMVATAGDMVITVDSAGWVASGTGTATFSARGQACTLQYINGKWFCVGNNGAVFA